MCLLVVHLLQCRSSLCIHPVNGILCVFIQHHYDCDSYFGEVVGEKYLLHLLSVYGVKGLGEVDE